jgi:hypothetical protein
METWMFEYVQVLLPLFIFGFLMERKAGELRNYIRPQGCIKISGCHRAVAKRYTEPNSPESSREGRLHRFVHFTPPSLLHLL